ncbi:unnamed protein product [Strongylus vulgaris]|uniref:Uncharacterized protein n=1 Tax=Strongylus vulgaris TaxID=40348 RepID=A0A3P7K770_STRVU|nr:unnamed protein product [Strongylus vulgaris]
MEWDAMGIKFDDRQLHHASPTTSCWPNSRSAWKGQSEAESDEDGAYKKQMASTSTKRSCFPLF